MRFVLSLALLVCFALQSDACGKRRAAAAASFDSPSAGYASYACSSCQPAAVTPFARPANTPTYFVPGNCPGGYCPAPTFTKPIAAATKPTNANASTALGDTLACVCDLAGGCDCSSCKCREFGVKPAKPLTVMTQGDHFAEAGNMVLPTPIPMLPVPIPAAGQ